MIDISSDFGRQAPTPTRRSRYREITPHGLLERLVYLPGALVLIYGFWLTLTA